MALLNNVRVCPWNCTSSKRFVQCIPDALNNVLIDNKIAPMLLHNKFSKWTLCNRTWLAKRKKNLVEFQQMLSPKHILRHFSTAERAPDAFTRFSTGIDFEALRDSRIKEMKLKGKDMNIHNIVKAIVKEKCDEAFANLNADEQRKLKIAQLEHDFLYSQGYDIIPADDMTSENWLDAINMTSSNQRRRFFYYLQNRQKVKRKEKSKKMLVSPSEVETQQMSSCQEFQVENKLFLRLYSSTVKRWQNHKLSNSLLYGIPLVWDMDYHDYMTSREIKNTASQLLDAYTINRGDHQMPFHMYFTSCPDDHSVYRYMQMYLQTDPHFMATVTSQNCLDLFDKKDLVYLSPHASQVMDNFNPNCVYILGAFNDKACQHPVSYARAKKLGVKCLQLPLDKYVQWKMGSKSLTLNQMMLIFQALKNKVPWYEALTAIPTRKIAYS